MILAVSLKKCTKSFSKVEDSDLAHFSENGKKSEIKNLLYKPILVHRSFLHFSHQCILLFKLGFSTKMLNNKKWLQNCKQISRRYIDLTKKCLLKNLEWKCTFFLLFNSALCHMKSGPPECLGMWVKDKYLEFWKQNEICH